MDAVPGELCIGLPARALLDAVERSPRKELLLVGGLRIAAHQIPELGHFAEKVWEHFCQAQEARSRAQISVEVHRLLCAVLLAGGADPASLPPGLSEAVRQYESLPKATYEACQAIVRPLVAFGLECGSQHEFKEKLELVIQSMADVGSEELGQYIYAVPHTVHAQTGQYVYAVPYASHDLEVGRP